MTRIQFQITPEVAKALHDRAEELRGLSAGDLSGQPNQPMLHSDLIYLQLHFNQMCFSGDMVIMEKNHRRRVVCENEEIFTLDLPDIAPIMNLGLYEKSAKLLLQEFLPRDFNYGAHLVELFDENGLRLDHKRNQKFDQRADREARAARGQNDKNGDQA